MVLRRSARCQISRILSRIVCVHCMSKWTSAVFPSNLPAHCAAWHLILSCPVHACMHARARTHTHTHQMEKCTDPVDLGVTFEIACTIISLSTNSHQLCHPVILECQPLILALTLLRILTAAIKTRLDHYPLQFFSFVQILCPVLLFLIRYVHIVIFSY